MKVIDIIREGVTLGCTDIHLDISEVKGEIVYRKHKDAVKTVVVSDLIDIFEYLKYLAHFDLSQINKPQSGAFEICLDDIVSCRYAALETRCQKNGVIRIFCTYDYSTLESCIYKKRELKKVREILSEPHGLILFVGPTGSGKSTTMFNGLIEQENSSIFSVESPIERIYKSIVQLEYSNINECQMLMRQVLRHNPSIICFGEIRYREELRNLIDASYTGHLVVATLHAGSFEQTIRRIMDLGANVWDLKLLLKGVIVHSLSKKNSHTSSVNHEVYNENTITKYLENF